MIEEEKKNGGVTGVKGIFKTGPERTMVIIITEWFG